MTYCYVDVNDLLFNGAKDCGLIKNGNRRMIKIDRSYSIGRNCDIYKIYYNGVHLASSYDCLTIGALDDALNALRGKTGYVARLRDNVSIGDVQEYSYDQIRKLKRAGIYVF